MNYLKRNSLVVGIATALSVSAMADSSMLNLDVKAQNAGSALLDIGEKAGVQIMISPELGRNLQLPGINGQYTLAEALDYMLEGTGLSYEMTSDNLVTVHADDDSVSDDEEEAKEADEEVVITGSRLKNISSGSYVQILTRDDIKQQGFGSIEDIVRSLPQNVSDTNAASTLDNSLNVISAQGHSAANLRGLGSGSTLILVNGRRWVQSATFGDGTVNLNGIPFSAIERVEVLLDGASAVYGADAQGGVINFILRKNFSGGETIVRHENSAHKADMLRVEQTLGMGWESGRAMLTLNYNETDPVSDASAGHTTADFRSRGGQDQRWPWYSETGIVSGLGALPVDDDGTNGVAGKLSPSNQVPYDHANSIQSVTAASESFSSFLSVEQELFEGFNLFGEVNYTSSKSTRAGGAATARMQVPESNRFNDLGEEVSVNYVFDTEIAAGLMDPVMYDSDQDSIAYTLGFNAELPFRDWSLDFSAGYAEEDTYFASTRLDTALLAERLAGVDGDGNPLPIEQIINPFGNGTAQSGAALEGLMRIPTTGGWVPSTMSAEQKDYLLSAEGGLFDLPAGEVRGVLGAEYRTELLDYSSVDAGLNVDAPERDVQSYFAELGLPLIAEHNRVFGVQSLDLKFALRHDQYSFDGPFNGEGQPFVEKQFSHTAPKVELAWHPVEELKIRSSWGESFRTPTLSALFGTRSAPRSAPWPIVDPEHPELGLQYPTMTTGGGPNLGPEVSDNLSYGFDWTPGGALEGLSLSVTETKIDISGLILPWYRVYLDSPGLLFTIPGVVERGSDNFISMLTLSSFNVASRNSESVDATVSYDFDTDWGAFRIGLNGTYTSLLRDLSFPGEEPVNKDGRDIGPDRLKVRGTVGWWRDNASLSLTANYSSSYEPVSWVNQQEGNVEHYLTFDLTGSYSLVDSDWKFNAGVRNLLNEEFPFYDGFGKPWDPMRVDTRGRIVYLEASKSYDFL